MPKHVRTGLALSLLAAACASSSHEERPAHGWPTGWPGPPVPAEQAAAVSVDADLDTLLTTAQVHNPGLQAAFHRWQAAEQQAAASGTLPNPRLTLAGYVSEIQTRTGPLQARVGLQQPIPWFGKLDARNKRARAEAEAVREDLERERLALVHEVRDAWYELAWLERAVAITRGHIELVQHWEGLSRARLETGLASHAEVIRTQVELGDLENRLRSLDDLRRPVSARLNAALDRAPGAPLPTPELPATGGQALDEDALLAGLPETSPELRGQQWIVTAAEHGIDLANKAFYPDLLVGAEVSFIGSRAGVDGSGDDALALTLGLDLPVWVSSNRAALRSAESLHAAALRALRQTQNELTVKLELALYRSRDAQRRVTLYRKSLIPKGEEAVEALSSAYESGDQGFLELIDAERVLLEFELQAARAEVDRAQARSQIEHITGVRLPDTSEEMP